MRTAYPRHACPRARNRSRLTEANGAYAVSVPVETGPSEPVGKVGDMPTPPCEPSEASPGLCEERDVATFRLFSFDEVGAAFPADEGTDSVEEVLEKGLPQPLRPSLAAHQQSGGRLLR